MHAVEVITIRDEEILAGRVDGPHAEVVDHLRAGFSFYGPHGHRLSGLVDQLIARHHPLSSLPSPAPWQGRVGSQRHPVSARDPQPVDSAELVAWPRADSLDRLDEGTLGI